MLRRRARAIEGRDRWGAVEELLFQRGFGYREPRYPSLIFSTHTHRITTGEGELATGTCLPTWQSARWVCQTVGLRERYVWMRRRWMGRTGIYMCAVLLLPTTPILHYYLSVCCLFGTAWTFVGTNCSLCLMQLYLIFLHHAECICYILLLIYVLHIISAYSFTYSRIIYRYSNDARKILFLHSIMLRCKRAQRLIQILI